MAVIDARVIFFTTSPRTAEKMIPEIELLDRYFAGQKWNVETQRAYMEILREENFFNGTGQNDPAFSARDRITRAPKAYGFVTLSPTIQLTPAGKRLISAKRKEDIFFRQLLKFQLPSPYHKLKDNGADFKVKPFLEILRLVRYFGTLRFDELKIFGLQLTNYERFDEIVERIEQFRKGRASTSKKYRLFAREVLECEIRRIYSDEIANNDIKTREDRSRSLGKFIATKGRNMHDYADACVRYLRATGMVNVSHTGRTLSIVPEHYDDVDFVLENVGREPVFTDDEAKYIQYLGSADEPFLLTDNKNLLVRKLEQEFPDARIDGNQDVDVLRDEFEELIIARRQSIIDKEVTELKNYRLYDEVQELFGKILTDRNLYDTPLLLEWNTWRAMTMLDGGDIKANLKFDDFGRPMSTAQGNMADIVCDYGDFGLSVEVTMASGQKQYEMEGEPVSRHLGKLKREMEKPAYCLFIAPVINPTVVGHFYVLHKLNVEAYGGKANIVPLPLEVFMKMLEDSCKAGYVPGPESVRRFFEHSDMLAEMSGSETEWYEAVKRSALDWLNIQ